MDGAIPAALSAPAALCRAEADRTDDLFDRVRSTAAAMDPPPLALLAERREDMLERAALIDGLDERLARLRAAIGGANVDSGIDALLARRAMLERRVNRLEGRREKGAEEDAGYWGRRRTVIETVDVQPLTREDLDRLEDELAEAKRALAGANDELLSRNLDATIHVADEDLETLRRERVI